MQKRQPRTPLRLPVSVGRRAAALTADISSGGFSLELPHSFCPGASIDGYVLHGDKELSFRGEVSWFRPADPRLSVWNELGVRFTWVSPGLRALLSLEQKRRRR